MPNPVAVDAVEILSMRCIAAEPGSTYDWHSHPFYEFSFVTDDAATIGYPPGKRAVARDSLMFYHAGERHAGWSGPKQAPHFWVVHFTATPTFLAQFPPLMNGDPLARVWTLRTEQAQAFRWTFLQILNERTQQREFSAQAEAAWLQLLLISVHRWIKGDTDKVLTPENASPELLELWHMVNASVGAPAELQQRLHGFANYDSLRHSFKRAFGCSPREMVLRLRIQHAKNLLLETSLSVKEIAARCGYGRQHEFARAFRQYTGTPPTEWRKRPFGHNVRA